MSDVILLIRYSAKVGESTFVSKVEDLVNEAENAARNTQVKGVSRHE